MSKTGRANKQAEGARVSLRKFADDFRDQMVPFDNKFSYFFAGVSMNEEDVREYLEEPIKALPPTALEQLPKMSVLFVPYLERSLGRDSTTEGDWVTTVRPEGQGLLWASRLDRPSDSVLAFAVQEPNLSDIHYYFYKGIADLIAKRVKEEVEDQYAGLLREELKASVHGEVDEPGWNLKQELIESEAPHTRRSKPFVEYMRQSYVDTLTLYLHGICCDIDIEPGPRQIPSRPLRKRLELLADVYPPGNGYAVFPEES